MPISSRENPRMVTVANLAQFCVPSRIREVRKYRLKEAKKELEEILKSPTLDDEEVALYQLEIKLLQKEIGLNETANCNLVRIIETKYKSMSDYILCAQRGDVFVSNYRRIQATIEKDCTSLQLKERELETWYLKKELQEKYPTIRSTWTDEKQRRRGIGFVSSNVPSDFESLANAFTLLDEGIVSLEGDEDWSLVLDCLIACLIDCN